MKSRENIPDDDAPDIVVHAVALVAVGIMLTGMVAFPLAGAWTRMGESGSMSMTKHGHGSVLLAQTRPRSF